MEKLEQLRALLSSYSSCLVAYSGGVDSALLAFVAHEVLGERALAVIADSPSLPRRELAEAQKLASERDIRLRVIQTREFEDDRYTSNPGNRCYFCKHELFTRLAALAREEGFSVMAYGENASDAADFRPGSLAAAEFRVIAPLREAGLTKNEIRQLSMHFGLPTASKAAMPCLSSRIPTGEKVNPEKLRMVEAAENFLRQEGFYEVRVRHHEVPGGFLARIELGREEMGLMEAALMERVRREFAGLGYAEVTVDPRGYRRGGRSAGL